VPSPQKEPEGPAKESTTMEKEAWQTPPAKESTTREEDDKTPPAMQKGDEETPPPAPASKRKQLRPLRLVSPYEPKKKAAGTVKFLKGIGKQRTARLVDLQQSNTKEAAAAPSKEAPAPSKKADAPLTLADIRTPTLEDYRDVPKDYVPGRPMLPWDVLERASGKIKWFNDWYMRAVHAGLNAFSVRIPEQVFASPDATSAYVTFEDMHLLLNYKKLDVQLVTIFCL